MKLKEALRYISLIQENDYDHAEAERKTGFWGSQGAGALILAKDTKRFLLQKRAPHVNEPNTWGITGGAIDEYENPEQACKREVQEELGYTGNMELHPIYLYKHPSGFVYHNFLGIVDKEFNPRKDHEVSDYQWFPWGQFPEPLHFGVKALLKHSKLINSLSGRI